MRKLTLTVAVMVVAGIGTAAFGSEPWETVKIEYNAAYHAARFKAADTNADGYLSAAEARAAQLNWECFRDAARWRHADSNGDGQLSLEECLAEKRFEIVLARKGLYSYHVWLRNRLATPGIDAREREQILRIQNGIANGSLTLEEAQGLLATEKSIRDTEAAAKADGKVTAEERESLWKALNAASKNIYDEKHDTDGRQLPKPGPNATPGISERQYLQACRIGQGVHSGSLTIDEAKSLIAGQKEVQGMKKDAKSDGKVTVQERVQIHKEQNEQSREIWKGKHDGERNPTPPQRPLPLRRPRVQIK